MAFETNLVRVSEVTSTNEVLFRAPLSLYPFGTALMAASQTAGRGRAQRVWQSDLGGLYLSVLFRPKQVVGLALLGAYCAVKVCQSFGVSTLIRWPNDIYHGERKLAGILPQVKFIGGQIERAVLGVGLNVSQEFSDFPSCLQHDVTTLARCLKSSDPAAEAPSVESVGQAFLTVLGEELPDFERLGCSALVERCQPLLQGYAEKSVAMVVNESGQERPLGRVAGLGPQGELLFEDGSSLHNLGTQERLKILCR